MAFMGNQGEESSEDTSGNLEPSDQEPGTEKLMENPEPLDHLPVAEGKDGVGTDNAAHTETEDIAAPDEKVPRLDEDGEQIDSADGTNMLKSDQEKTEYQLSVVPVESSESTIQNAESSVSVGSPQENKISEVETTESPVSMLPNLIDLGEDKVVGSTSELGELHGGSDAQDNFQVKTEEESFQVKTEKESFQVKTEEESKEHEREQTEQSVEQVSPVQPEALSDNKDRDEVKLSVATEETDSIDQSYNEHPTSASLPNESSDVLPELGLHENEATQREIEGDHLANAVATEKKGQHLSSVASISDSDSLLELEKVKKEMKMMETALQGAARQAQVFHLFHLIMVAAKNICDT